MKKELQLPLLGICLGLAGVLGAQNTFPASGPTGLGTLAPAFMLDINAAGAGSSVANSQGWRNAIRIQRSGALYWDGSAFSSNHFFMGYPSQVAPTGDYYQGFSQGAFTSAAPVIYTSKVFVTSAFAGNPQGTSQIYKNLLVLEPGFIRCIGANMNLPKRAGDFQSTQTPQLRVTQTENTNPALGIYTDFQAMPTGHLNIMPRNGSAALNVGIDAPSPTEKLHVNGNARLANVPSASADYLMTGLIQGGVNDIAFRKLAFTGNFGDILHGNGTWAPAASAAFCAFNGLSINANGCAQFGQDCGDPANPAKLGSDREIPMAFQNIFFGEQGKMGTNAIVHGGFCGFGPITAKFNVIQQDPNKAFGTSIGITGINYDVSGNTSGIIIGVEGQAETQDGNWAQLKPLHIGVRGHATGGAANFGVYGVADEVAGVGGEFYGGYFESNGVGTGTRHFGVYARSMPAPGNGGGPNWAGFFDGDLISTTFIGISDRNLKKDITTLERSIDLINKLNPVSYHFDTEKHKDIGLNSRMQYGFISQEVKEILPDLTATVVYPELHDSKGAVTRERQEYLGINYDGFIALLTQAVQEQQKEINELKALVKAQATETTRDGIRSGNAVVLDDAQAIVLEQNVPNPFAEQTSISYTLTDGVQKAQMLFYNTEGKLINSVDLKATAGKNQLNVFASDLSSGIYSYTLVVDGKIIETKRMVKN